jgi:hypothetical protein
MNSPLSPRSPSRTAPRSKITLGTIGARTLRADPRQRTDLPRAHAREAPTPPTRSPSRGLLAGHPARRRVSCRSRPVPMRNAADWMHVGVGLRPVWSPLPEQRLQHRVGKAPSSRRSPRDGAAPDLRQRVRTDWSPAAPLVSPGHGASLAGPTRPSGHRLRCLCVSDLSSSLRQYAIPSRVLPRCSQGRRDAKRERTGYGAGARHRPASRAGYVR